MTLAKADVGLGNVDNTSDLNKPVSTATQSALNAKEDKTKLTFIQATTTTPAATAAKVATTGGSYTPTTGDIIVLTFTLANTASNPTLNIDGSGAKSILIGNAAPSNIAVAGTKVTMWYDGTAYQLFGSQRNSDANTTYAGITGSSTIVTTETATLAINRYTIANYLSGLQTLTLPASAAVGSIIEVYSMAAGAVRVSAPAGDNILYPDATDTGTAGWIQIPQYGTVTLRCIVDSTTWMVTSASSEIFNNSYAYTGLDTKESLSNKDTDTTLAANSDINYPSQKAVKTYVDNNASSVTISPTAPPTPNNGQMWVDTSDNGVADLVTAVGNMLHPVGSVYISIDSANPATYLGFGTWEAWGSGHVPVGVDAGQTEFNTVEKTGGAKTHTLTVAQMPAHKHTFTEVQRPVWWISDARYGAGGSVYSQTNTTTQYATMESTLNSAIQNTGGGGAHNNLQPYITCYMWKRTI